MHQTVFENVRLFFIQLIFMYEVEKCPKHSGSESLPLLHHCRDPMESWPSNLKIGDGYVIAASWVNVPPFTINFLFLESLMEIKWKHHFYTFIFDLIMRVKTMKSYWIFHSHPRISSVYSLKCWWILSIFDPHLKPLSLGTTP